MDLVQNSTSARRLDPFGPTLIVGAIILAMLALTILVVSMAPGPSTRQGIESVGNPLVQPAIVEFRWGERAVDVSVGDPLVQPAIVEFRRGERAVGNAVTEAR